MDVLQGIVTRRSIRSFSERGVEPALVERVVKAASCAPSWKNSQTVRYIVVADKGLRLRIAEECTLGFAKNRGIMQSAPLLVLLTTVEGISGFGEDGSFATTKGGHWQSFDAGLAAQTFCLAAHAEGCGTVILGLFDEPAIKRLCGVPEGQSISAVIAMGWPAESPAMRPRKAVDELLRWV